MARKKDDGSEIVGWILTFMFLGIFFLIKWTIEAIIFFIKLIIDSIKNKKIKNNKKKQNQINNIVDSSFSKTAIKPTNNIKSKDIFNKLELFETKKYNHLFEPQIRRRGEEYVISNKIQNIIQAENLYTCKVIGTETYDVSLRFDNDNNIIHSNCTCPYFQDKKKNCKHIYALLLETKCKDNSNKVVSEIDTYIDELKTMIISLKDYMKENSKKYSKDEINKFNNYITSCELKINRYKQESNNYRKDESTLLKILEQLIDDSAGVQYLFKNIIQNNIPYSSSALEYLNRDDKITLGEVATGLFIANEVDKHIHKHDDDYDDELEKEMDRYGLDEDEKNAIRSGNYTIENFDMDNWDEDNYYWDEDEDKPE